MNKTILIGFFLAFTTGCGMKLGISNGEAYWCRDLQVTSLLFIPRLPSRDQLPGETNNEGNQAEVFEGSGRYSAWWMALAVALLILPLYLLFLVRKRQLMAKQIEVLQADIMVLFNHAPCGYYAIDEKGMMTQVNSTLLEWLGYGEEEISGKLSVADIIEGDQAVIAEKTAALLSDAVTGKMQLNLTTKSGETLPVIIQQVPTAGLPAGGWPARGQAGIKRGNKRRLFSIIDNRDCHEAMERIKSLDHELESFSYSISHDLRAPLRSIDGYSKILQEDYAPNLGEEGRRVLSVIMSNAKRMGKLIDDLLEFGRLGRKTMQHSQVNMGAMASTIADNLKAQAAGRKIDVQIGELHAAFADADMMRQVWFNILDNAVKYTGKKEVATIEISSYETARGEICYEVKDNGVGFDMKYAHKLFGVFQRLHKIQDFRGTGVGLAMIKRIISRHGGRVWAKASLETGAIFYFTIPIGDANKK